jgi:hypothetical protein
MPEQTHQEMLDRIAFLEKQVANKKAVGTSLRISTKGAVSVYGLQRFPVTLYAEQWETLAKQIPAILTFITLNRDNLAVKAVTPAVTAEQPTA